MAAHAQMVGRSNQMNIVPQTAPLKAGDLIVIEIGGKLVPRRPWDNRPQWFVALEDQDGASRVRLKPFDNPTAKHTAKKVVAGWAG